MQMEKILLLVITLLGVQLFFLFNLQFTAWPEMLSYPYLRNHGFLIYKDMIHPYPPLLTMGLSWLYSLFGYNLLVLKAVAWLIILVSSLLVFLITREITKSNRHALLALGVYVFFQPFLEGNMLWFDIAVIPPILLGLYFLIRKNLFLAGLFLAIAMLTKQTAGLYLVLSFFYLVPIQKMKFSSLKPFLLGPLLLGIPLLVRLIQEGALSDFINWVFVYPLTKWGTVAGYVQMEMSEKQIFIVFLLIVPLVLNFKNLLANKNIRLVLLFLSCALIGVYPRFSFFHFQTA